MQVELHFPVQLILVEAVSMYTSMSKAVLFTDLITLLNAKAQSPNFPTSPSNIGIFRSLLELWRFGFIALYVNHA